MIRTGEKFDYFQSLYEQLYYIITLSKDLEYLHPTNPNLYHEAFLHSRMLDVLLESLKINFSLKLHSFLNHTEDNNIVSFLGQLINEYPEAEWQVDIELGELMELKRSVSIVRRSKEFKTIEWFRNKIYAHVDSNSANTNLKTDLDTILPRLNELVRVLTILGRKLFQRSLSFTLLEMDKDNNIVQDLSQFYELRDYINNFRYGPEKHESLSIDTILKCFDKYPK